MLSPATPNAGAGIAGVNPATFEWGGHERHRGDYSIGADSNARGNKRACAHPHSIFQNNWSMAVLHIQGAIVVIAGAEDNTLRKATIRANGYAFEVDNAHFFPDPGEITDCEFPGKIYIDTGFPINPLSDFRAKYSEQPGFDT